MACSKLPVDKKRKVDFENREFKSEWTEKYAFVLPVGSTKPMCLICSDKVAIIKSGNVKRHYETKHAHFEQNYPQNTELRTTKINQLKSSYEATSSVIVRSATQQERATEASLRVAWVLGKHKKPFSVPLLQKMALQILTMFPSTYCCESAFSTMNMVKNAYRSTLTNEHLHQCLRLALTPFMPKFKQLVAQRRCHLSH